MARAANVSFTFTNSFNQPDTNWFKVIPVSGPVAYADGSFTTIGVPIRVVPNTNGIAITNIPQNNYLVTNAFLGQGYYIRVPLDSGPTVYPSGQIRISGGNVFVTVVITNGTIASLTYQILTNALGGAPLFTTNLPALTNGHVSAIDITNLFNALILAPTNGFTSIVYSNASAFVNLPIFTNTFNALAVPITNGMTSIVYSNPAAFTTPVTVTNITQALLMVATNGHIRLQDATNVFNALILNVTNVYGTIAYSNANAYTTIALLNSTSNLLQSLIGSSGGISAQTATNISSAATNGLISLKDATNVANAIVLLATNGLASVSQLSSTSNLLSLAQISGTNLQAAYNLQTYALSNSPVIAGPLTVISSGGSGTVFSNASGAMNVFLSMGQPLDVLYFLGLGLSLSAASPSIGTNFVSAAFIAGNGGGGPNTGVLSNAWATNLTGSAGVLVSNWSGNVFQQNSNGLATATFNAATNAGGAIAGERGTNAFNNLLPPQTNIIVSMATNLGGLVSTQVVANLAPGLTNGYVDKSITNTLATTNGSTLFNCIVTNSAGASLTNIYIGPYLIFQQSTNLVHFNTSGTAGITNGLYEWAPTLGVALNYYTNAYNGGYITNNGTVWQLFSSGGAQLFSSPRLDTNSWTLQSGTGAAASVWGAYEFGDGSKIVGIVYAPYILTNSGGAATNAIGNKNGFGTNTYITNLVIDWNVPTPSENQSANSGANLNFQAASFGQANTNTGSGYGAIIAGGATNKITLAGDSFIGAGIGNTLGGGFNNGDFIGAGLSNNVGGIDRSFLGAGTFNQMGGADSFLGAGYKNNVGNVSYSAIVTGNSNNVGSSYSFIGAGTNNILQSQAGAILTGFNNQAINPTLAFLNVGNIILGGSNNVVSNTWWNLEWGQNVFSSNQWNVVFADSQVNTVTNSQAILKFTNGVMVNTNNAGGNGLQVLGKTDSTGGFSTAGTNITALNTAPNLTTPTNVNIAGAIYVYQDTNNIAFTNAGTTPVTNGIFHWFTAQGQFSNQVTGEILTNNAGTFNLFSAQGGSVLYSTNNLISSPWAVNTGTGPGPGSYYAPTADSHVFYGGYVAPTNVLRILSDTNANINTNGILVNASNGTSTNQTLIAPTNVFGVRVSWLGTNVTFTNGTTPLQYGAAWSNAVTMALGIPFSRVDVSPGVYDLTGFSQANMSFGMSMYGSGQGVTYFSNQINGTAFPLTMAGSNILSDFSTQAGAYISDARTLAHGGGIVQNVNIGGGDFPLIGDGYYIVGGRLATNTILNSVFSSCFDAFNVDSESGATRNAQVDLSIYGCKFNAISTTNTSSSFSGETIVRAFAITSGSNSIYRLYNCNLNAASIILSNGVTQGYTSALSFGKPNSGGAVAYTVGTQVWLKGCNLSSSATNGYTGGIWDIDFQAVCTNASVFVDPSTVFNPSKINWAGTSNFIYFVSNGQTNGYIQDGHFVFTPQTTAALLPTNSLGNIYISNSPAGGTNSVYIPWNSNGTIYNLRFLTTLQ